MPIPWNARDAWLGLLSLPLLVAPLALYAYFYRGSVNLGLLLVVGELIILTPVVVIAVIWRRATPSDLGLRPFSARAFLGSCLALFIVYSFTFTFTAFLALLFWLLGWPLPEGSAALLAQLPQPWVAFLAAVVMAPLAEELFFRGFLYAGLETRYGWRTAAVLSSLAFGLAHLDPLQFVALSVVGFVLALVYRATRSLWPAILLHAMINLFGLLAIYLLLNMGLTP